MKSKLLLVILVAGLSWYPGTSPAQIPDLGTAAAFAVFTSAGAFANTGLTIIDGDIGDNSEFVTGFPPGVVTGTIQPPGSITNQASTDLANAYSNLSSLDCNASLDVSMGNNEVVTPGVYCLNAASTIDGTLILDGLGNPDAVFIFLVNGTLITGKFSNVVLINSASYSNVFWQVSGAVTLGDSCAFRGNILSAGAISILTGAALAGRALSLSGAVALSTNRITINSDVTILPIKLLAFTGDCDHQNVRLSWSTASESDNERFSIEHSADGLNWMITGTVKGAGNSGTLKNYTFTDSVPGNAVSYYRLMQTDLDGKFTYSKVISVANCLAGSNELSVYPVPANRIINLSFTGDKSKVGSIVLYDIAGKKVFAASQFQSRIDLSGTQDGIYYLHLNAGSNTTIKKIVIRR